MKKIKSLALLIAALLIVMTLTACTPELYGDWVTEDGTTWFFTTNTVTINNVEEYEYMLGDNNAIALNTEYGLLEGYYSLEDGVLTISFGSSTVVELTPY